MSDTTMHSKDEHLEDDKAAAQALEQEKMHGWDFAFSLVVMLFSIGVIATSLTMPFSGTVGGVTTEWYESPGLLPLFIGCSLFAAGLSVFMQSKNEQGRERFLKYFKEINPSGFLVSAGGIISYIYVLITWYDFFLASAVFLLLYIGLYYLDEPEISKKLLKIYYGNIALSTVIFMTGIDQAVNSGYPFTTDFLLAATGVAMIAAMYSSAKKANQELVQKVRRMTLIAIIFPAVLCPIFRYFLLVPLPKEGLVVEQVFNTTYYTYISTGNKAEEVELSDEQMSQLEDAF
ncbi:hypothetical protein L3Q72_17920 [Vibrio sp. JC009]|uniref:hypothetical protein n=1 Tax=Vibrio sp. JC009 TaxID=2912314 RepID=UPI0023B1E2B4|nr:hypothetical protein [Vibrio sp. JC009]WED24753.1 hypothetical protein L3Q72_17920 [Vibrio sp. JC009]